MLKTQKKTSESCIQANFFQRCWNELPETRRLIFSVPNGSTRDIREAVKLKATGLIPGIPDIVFIWNGTVHGIEFKTDTGKLSEAQEKCHNAWKQQGVNVVIVRSADKAFEFVKKIVNSETEYTSDQQHYACA